MRAQRSPFQHLLGERFEELPLPVQRIHSISGPLTAAGLADVFVTRGSASWLIRRIARMPRPGRKISVTVSFQPDGRGGERWLRSFAGRHYASTISTGGKTADSLLVERLGLFDLYFRLTPRPGSLEWLLVGWRFLGVPLPAWSIPVIRCRESSDAERYVFDIDAAFPVIGPVIHYRGWLIPQEQTNSGAPEI